MSVIRDFMMERTKAFVLCVVSICMMMVLMMVFYAASTPSRPRTVAEEINWCIAHAEGLVDGHLREPEHVSIAKACAEAIRDHN